MFDVAILGVWGEMGNRAGEEGGLYILTATQQERDIPRNRHKTEIMIEY